MNKILINKTIKNIEYPKYSIVKIPIYSNKPKYSKFKNFLDNKVEYINYWPSCDNNKIKGIIVEDYNTYIDIDKCIGCLLCFSTEKYWDSLKDKLKIILKKILPNYNDLESYFKIYDIFSGNAIIPPKYKGDRKIRDFENFTLLGETTHLSLWGCSVLNFLSSDLNSRLGKEIEISLKDCPRDGRLDIVILSKKQILICESKKSLDSLLTEDRYRIQIPNYRNECKRIINNYEDDLNSQILLLIGGNETDLYPPDNSICTSKVGGKSQRFYDNLIKFDLKFISANALWLIMLRTLFFNKKICWDLLFNRIYSSDVLGLLTSGIVRNKNGNFIIDPIQKKDLMASEIVLP